MACMLHSRFVRGHQIHLTPEPRMAELRQSDELPFVALHAQFKEVAPVASAQGPRLKLV